MRDEEAAISGGRGKWSKKGVPHKGWTCVSEYDAREDGGDLIYCDMCETTQVRFVHVMQHAEYPEMLHCGCICSAHMSGDRKRAEDREKRMRSKASRRSNCSRRKGWKIAGSGNPYIVVDGFHFVVVKKSDGRFAIGGKRQNELSHGLGRRRFNSLEDAKTGCFDALEFFERERLKR